MTLDEIKSRLSQEFAPDGRHAGDYAMLFACAIFAIGEAYESGKRDGMRDAATRATRVSDLWEDDG